MSGWAQSQAAEVESVSFSREIAPILIQKCINCHGLDKAKGGYRLHNYRSLVRAGDSDRSPIDPPTQSELVARITTEDEDDRMPQKDEPLPAAEVDLIRRWVEQGAVFDGEDPEASLQTLAPAQPGPVAPEVYPRSIPILSLAFDPKGSVLAAGGYGEITLWNPTNGALVGRWRGSPERSHSLAFSPDGALLAVGGGAPGQYGEVLLLETKHGGVVQQLGRTRDSVLAVGFDPHGHFLAACGADRSIRVYELPRGTQSLLIQQHADWVLTLAIDPEGKRLASGSRDGTARVYSLETGELESTHHDHHAPVWAVAFDTQGERLLSSGADREVHFWKSADGKPSGELKGLPGGCYGIVVSGDSFFTAGSVVRQYKTESRKLVREFTGPEDTVYALAYHSSSGLLAAGTHSGQVHVWQSEDGERVATFPGWPGGTGK